MGIPAQSRWWVFTLIVIGVLVYAVLCWRLNRGRLRDVLAVAMPTGAVAS